MSIQQLNELRNEVYTRFHNAKGEEKEYCKKVLDLFDYTLKIRHALDTISKIGVSHI
tara:strand:- start:740 stop:910 length:171 start_codon:yes stop_codon:yes gene_type:complete